jgi:hypothetical protein
VLSDRHLLLRLSNDNLIEEIIIAQTLGRGNATATNSGSDTGGIGAGALGGGNATAINSGSNNGGNAAATTDGNATANNSGSNSAEYPGVDDERQRYGNQFGQQCWRTSQTNSGNATAINSGTNNGGFMVSTALSNTTVINSGVTTGLLSEGTLSGTVTLTNIIGGRVIGDIDVLGTKEVVNFQGGNWLSPSAARVRSRSTPTGRRLSCRQRPVRSRCLIRRRLRLSTAR